MLGPIAIIPSAPVLVPELAGAAPDAAEVRAAVLSAASSLPQRWVALGAGPQSVFGPHSTGSFAGYGVDLAVHLSPRPQPCAELPLCALMAGWVRGRTCPAADVLVHTFDDPLTARSGGRRIRAQIDKSPEPVGVLVLADGANTVSAAAPGGYHPSDIDVQRVLDDALAAGDIADLIALPLPVVGRAVFAALAGLADVAPRSVTQLYRGAPYGVGYFVGVWHP